MQMPLAGSLQAEQPYQLCGIHTRLHPLGLNFAPACERCCHDHDINATTLYSSEMGDTSPNILSPSLNPAKSLDQLARVNTAGCVIASHILHQFRRLLLEHRGMQHAPSSVPLSVPK